MKKLYCRIASESGVRTRTGADSLQSVSMYSPSFSACPSMKGCARTA
jgi:hypothetical protein